jgi:HSP20 family protein
MASRDPRRDVQEMMAHLNRMVAEGQTDRGRGEERMTSADLVPVVDVIETDTEIIIQAELAGVAKDHIQLAVQNGVLTLSAYRASDSEQQGRRSHRTEIGYGRFVRSFTVPDYVDENRLTAEFRNGVLTIHLPKSEKVKPKSIEVKVG